MSLKVNNLSLRPRIVIDVMPDGTSTMKAQGGLNMVAVSVILSNQLNTLLPRMFQELFKNSMLTDAKGQPVLTNPGANVGIEPNEPEPQPEPEKIQ